MRLLTSRISVATPITVVEVSLSSPAIIAKTGTTCRVGLDSTRSLQNTGHGVSSLAAILVQGIPERRYLMNDYEVVNVHERKSVSHITDNFRSKYKGVQRNFWNFFLSVRICCEIADCETPIFSA